MRISNKFVARTVMGETIIVNQGQGGADLTKIISLNSTAKELWEAMKDREFTAADAAQALTDAYGIDEKRAMADAEKWIADLQGCGVIAE